MALKLGLNQGSLLRRTLLHVTTLVLASMAFVAVASFTLVSVARGLLPPPGGASDSAGASADETAEGAGKAAKPAARVRPGKPRPGDVGQPPSAAD